MVLGAATRLFTERGWAGTTLAAVAAQAGTAVETVYAALGRNRGCYRRHRCRHRG